MSLFEDMPALSPVQFFGLSSDCLYLKGSIKPEKSHLLPSAADLLDEEVFADVYAGWNVDKLSFYVAVHQPFQKVGEGDFRRGDSIELFIDTRDLKTKGGISRSCHHFVFFPIQVQNFYGREITRFRGDDLHRLSHPEDLSTAVQLFDDSYHMQISLSASSLHGYDPVSFP